MTINVTKSFLPPIEEYFQTLERVWEKGWLTNRGPLALDLEKRLKEYLSLRNLLFVSNGTIAIQVAIKALQLKGDIITTPFSYVATTTSILWEGCNPVFVDIEPETWCINPELIEASINPSTTAILATHVFGYPCNVELIESIAKRNNLKVIYDAAHAFGVEYKGKSLFAFGDISTCSFHATKVFHTGEGGAIISNDEELDNTIFNKHTFGHILDEYFEVGINAKNSEIHAALGIVNLPYVQEIINKRKEVHGIYNKLLRSDMLKLPSIPADIKYNYSYYPVLFSSEKNLLDVKKMLNENGINTRRYFYPSLNELPYLKGDKQVCPISESVSRAILCLPMYAELKKDDQLRIIELINSFIVK